jgi:hypothetical protein
MRRIQAVLAVASYITVLLLTYATLIAPRFGYVGLEFHSPEPISWIWMSALCAFPVILLPLAIERPSAVVVWWLYLVAYIPSVFIPIIGLQMPPESVLEQHASMCVCMSTLALITKARTLRIPRIYVPKQVFWWGLLTSTLFVCAAVMAYAPPQLSHLRAIVAGTGSEYDIRSSFARASRVSIALGYAMALLSGAVAPYIISMGIVRKRYALIVFGVVVETFAFAATGAKDALFAPLFLFAVMWTLRNRRQFGIRLTLLLAVAVGAFALFDGLLPRPVLSGMITRREILYPGMLAGMYWKKFSEGPKVYLTNGIGKYLPGAMESVSPSYQIGGVYFKGADANAHLWAEGFAQFGIPGIFAFTAVVALALWLYDTTARRGDLRLAVLAVSITAHKFSNTSPLTVLVTHGFILIAILLAISPDEKLVRAPGPAQFMPSREPAEANCHAMPAN